jgi:hypothetical protein
MPETFCVQCGTAVPQGSGFCPSCGQPAQPVPATTVQAPVVQAPPVQAPAPITPTVGAPPVTGYVQPPPYVPPPTNGQAVAGFVLSLVGLFLAVLVIPVVLAIVFSSIGISRAKEIEMKTGQPRGRGLAIAGLVISIVSAFGVFVWFVV